MKHYKFQQITYYTSNGCDCCEPDEWIIYNCDELISEGYGSCTGEWDIMQTLLERQGVDQDVLYSEEITFEDLTSMLGRYKISYEIIEEEI